MSGVHFHFHFDSPGVLPLLKDLKGLITMNQTELTTVLTTVAAALTPAVAALGNISAQLEKATGEIVVALSAQGQTSPEVDAAVVALQGIASAFSAAVVPLAAAAQGLDDLHVDAEPTA